MLAMQRFPFFHALDRDTGLRNEPTEFRTIEEVNQHIRRLLSEEFEVMEDLRQRKIVDSAGFLLLPPK